MSSAALLGIVFLAGILLLVDLLSPKIGWVRDHLQSIVKIPIRI